MQALTRARTCTTRLTRTLATSSPCSQNKPTSPTLSPEDHSGTLEYAPLPTPRTPLSAYSLPDTKLRALIDLYHSSSSFITPETLSDEIDKAFAPVRYIGPPFRPESYRNLVDLRDERSVEPDRVVPSANELGGLTRFEGVGAGWSASKGERARMVKAALWGVDPMAKIGLETLLEAKAEMDSQEGVQEIAKEQKTPKE